MAKNKKSLLVQGDEITLLPQKGQEDYISLTKINYSTDTGFTKSS